MEDKAILRKQLRDIRRDHVNGMPKAMRGLVFRHPPAAILQKIGPDAVIGLYHAAPYEAPTASYLGHFHEKGHRIALPRFASRSTAMEFADHVDPYGESDLQVGPFGMLQPLPDAAAVIPDLLFMPLIGFTARGERLGQGGGHYDRWLAEHPGRIAIGLAWDVQLCEELPREPHDVMLDAVVTPTRMYGPL